MTSFFTSAGRVQVLEHHAAFAELAGAINHAGRQAGAAVALSGGSTPTAFYKWAVEFHALHAEAIRQVEWYVSDERCVPLTSPDSNFGNAERHLLHPLAVPPLRCHPWPVDLVPEDAAAAFSAEIQARLDEEKKAFDLCVLGLGDDSHTASLWPQCPLIGAEPQPFFAATKWPERGWRLTITEKGLAACGRIIVLAFGANKAAALRAVMEGPLAPAQHPAQVLRKLADRVTWLVDAPAASLLEQKA